MEPLVCELEYVSPFDWAALHSFLVGRASVGVETVVDGRYIRTAAVGSVHGWFSVELSHVSHAVRVEIAPSLAPAIPELRRHIERVFDLAADTHRIAAHLGALAEARPGLRVPGAFDGFEMAVRAVLGQQISVRAATTLAGRFVRAFGEPIETPFPQLTHLSPTPERVASASREEIIAIGIIAARSRTLLALSRAVADGSVDLSPGADVEAAMARLKEVPGIGEWTAQYIAMRALGWRDAFPHTDLGIYKALGMNNPLRVLELAAAWSPYRAYAAMHLWKSLEAA